MKAAGTFLHQGHNIARYTEVMQVSGKPFQMAVCAEKDTGHGVPEADEALSPESPPPWRRRDAQIEPWLQAGVFRRAGRWAEEDEARAGGCRKGTFGPW